MPARSESLPVTGNTEHTQPENRAFYPALDGLRAIAFLMVFGAHYYALPWGWTGVNIFFVLSGFLITGILFDSRNDLHRARNFYIRRTLRIFPLYYGIFLVLLLSYPLFHWHRSLYWLAWPLYLGNFLRFLSPSVLTANSTLQLAANAWLRATHFRAVLFLGHFWSLCVEEQFYLFWPWIVFWVRSRKALLWICGISVGIGPLLRVLAQHTAPAWMLGSELLYRATPFQLDSLLLGGLIALLWRGSHRKELLAIGRIAAVLFGVAAVTYLAFTINFKAVPNWHEGYRYPSDLFTWSLSFVNFFTAAIILTCLHANNWLSSFLSLRPLRWLGRISYGAYVFHDIFHDLYFQIILGIGRHNAFFALHPKKLAALLALPCSIVLAWLSFHFFESRFLDLKERWTIHQPASKAASH